MSYSSNPYQASIPAPQIAAHAAEWERTAFIRRTYTHLFGAISALVGLEALLFLAIPESTRLRVVEAVSGTRFTWFIILGLFIGVSWIANSWARSSTSIAMQYLGLGLYVVAQAAILLPMLTIADVYSPQGTIPIAAILTMFIFGGLTAIMFLTRADMSWLGRFALMMALALIGIAACGAIFNFHLGLWFSGFGIALATAYILYDTSNVMHHYRTDQHVAASLALFASVALLFWYVLRLVMALNRD